ncbi:MAG TPA: L-histidine N(alpha)-methyltransferase [Acidimicrobiales bacterium]|nr:L-histidine N(alpha)-methyltransferase [Acidimicrobiales bacterium]
MSEDACDETSKSIIPPSIDIHLTDLEQRRSLEEDARAGFTSEQKWTAPVWFYDDRGSQLFDEITRLPEYYPTRAERLLLELYSDDIAERSGADTLVELGAGTCEKSRILLDALGENGTLRRYVPLDVSDVTLWGAAKSLSEDYPGLEVNAVVADFHRQLDRLPSEGKRMIAFLGGTIGNLTPKQRSRFLFDLDCNMSQGDSLLLGTDLVKESDRLVAAYDDEAGVTAQFNLNVLRVLNRELGASFEEDRFEHVAVWDEDEKWIEMRLRSTTDQVVAIEGLDIEVEFDEGEHLRTEISAKFTSEQVQAELWDAGFVVKGSWSGPEDDFLLTLATPYC